MTNRSRVVLYTGVTNNLTRRVWEHQHGAIEDFTRKYHLTKLVHCEIYGDVLLAIQRGKEIKGWRRSKKNALVEASSPWWQDLFATLDLQTEIPRRASPARNDRVKGTARKKSPETLSEIPRSARRILNEGPP